jgi:LPS-assembly protein
VRLCHAFLAFCVLFPPGADFERAQAQIYRPNLPPPRPQTPAPTLPRSVPARPNQPARDEILIRAVTQIAEGPWLRLRGHAEIETTEMLIRADEMDYNQDTGDAEARGNVYFMHYERNEELRADKVEYNVGDETGKFHNVRGNVKTAIDARAGLLSSANPFYFQAEWADRLSEKFILHNAFLTNCRLPKPWWTLRGPRFDIIPGQRAIAYRSVFRVKALPVFYAPAFYKSLEHAPRRSGFLVPNIGNSSRRGKMIGIAYYWAINRSQDLTYRVQDFTARGIAHHVEVRGKPRAGTDYDAVFYGVADRGLLLKNGERLKQGGYSVYMAGQSDLGHGFYARGTLNFLSSLTFRQAFTESFNEAIFAEAHSTGWVSRQWSSWSLNVLFERIENFQSSQPGDSVVIRKLPELNFSSRYRKVSSRVLPVWVSFDTTAGLLRRSQPLFQTRQFMERADFAPRVMTALRWKDFHILPGFGVRGTHYGERQESDPAPRDPFRTRILGKNFNQTSREFFVDVVLPSLSRVYDRKLWLADRVKHVIEPRASFRHVSGVLDFNRSIRFDETELLSNTTEAEVSLANRFFAKKNGVVSEVLSWEVWQRRYFDPDFGGAVVDGRRNILASGASLTPYTFLSGARSYSPVVSVVRATPVAGMGVEWRSDYDPLLGGVANSGFTVDGRVSNYFASVGHNHVHSDPRLSPSSNQFRGQLGFGSPNRQGWTAAFTSIYDFRLGIMQFATTQVTYNSDCCGISLQYRRFSFGTRNENQFRVAFALANIGTFGTLKKQERLF